MNPAMSPMRMGYEPQLEEVVPACISTQQKIRSPDAVLLLLSLTAVMFYATMAIGYITRGSRAVHDDTTVAAGRIAPTTPTLVKTTPATRKHTPAAVVVPVDLSVHYKPTLGTGQPTGDLPAHVEPQHYDVAIMFDGANLANSGMKVTGRAEASLEVPKATSKLILKAKAIAIKELRMAVLEVPAVSGEEPQGLNITTLSTSGPFLIAALETPLEAGKSYTLVTEYDYDKSVRGGPISLTAETGSVSASKFKDVLAMPPDMLACTFFPTTLKFAELVPDKMSIYAKTDNADLKASAKETLEFLPKYIQALVKDVVTEIETMFADVEFPQASETQEGLGFVGLEARNTPATIWARTTNQWTYVVMHQLTSPASLGLAGVSYLCRLAINEQNKRLAALMKDFKERKKDTPAPGTWVKPAVASCQLPDADFRGIQHGFLPDITLLRSWIGYSPLLRVDALLCPGGAYQTWSHLV